MNDILQKCVDELSKEAPRIDYIRGMLESVLVMNKPTTPVPTVSGNNFRPIRTTLDNPPTLTDEENAAVELYEKGPIGKIT